ncbi:MAG: hypothetical protein J1E64_14955 [Acetatifactor sp.]|nr:hypothetical protein [Acetatifactor sp.]
MGKSKSIADQAKANQEFQKYVNDMNKDMDTRQSALSDTLASMQEEHYKNFTDKALLIEGKYSHLTTTSQWSLQSVSDIIDSCSKAIFGSKAPAGSEKSDSEGEDVSASIQAIKDREMYIANAAFDVVQSIVGSFGSTTSASVERKLDGKPISPGMTLFIGVENNSYSSKNFFTNEKIIQTIFVFKVYYSIQEGKAQSTLSDLQMYEDQKQVFRNKIEEFAKMVEKLDPMADDFEEQYTKLMNRSELMNQRLDDIGQKIAALSADKLQQEKISVARTMERIRSGRQGLLQAANTIYQANGTPFTYNGHNPYDRIMMYVPSYVRISLSHTDYKGNHYEISATSSKPITDDEVDRWVSSAFDGDPYFFFD